ncbi:MAG: hypothetical protein COT84_06860 [Chlamydiae bacterium CG10_big_fil_rev_8_21_14_0_10_35_9]|nr:MAG: hypothetical protein COT84_06860 [Chlamydiae bacterium CG10_big_fil_rev_8_21_14_0_10_35_9]
MAKKQSEAQNPLILRFHRLMDAFAKSDDERDFYLDKMEGFIVYVDLDKQEQELEALDQEISTNSERYCLIPKMTFYEVKKFMEGFVNEKVYDIDTKEKLLDIIGARDSRENFLEFIYDHLTELEKWQAYYQERSRIRIIEWLRNENIHFVFEEDLDINVNVVEKVKRNLFEAKVPKDVANARDAIQAKAKTYYSNEALNPRPKRGRPPKQQVKVEIEPQFTVDIYTTVPKAVRPFLYIPDITSASAVTFSAKFETEEELLASLRGGTRLKVDEKLEALSQRLESLRTLSDRLAGQEKSLGIQPVKSPFKTTPKFSDKKSISLTKGEEKFESAVGGALTGRKAPTQEDGAEIFAPQKRKKFSRREVSPINPSKKKQKE